MKLWQARSGGGGAVPLCPGPIQTCTPLGSLEPQAGSNLSNSKLTLIFLLFLSIDNITICPFYDYFSNSSCTSILFTIFFFEEFYLIKMIGYYGQMTNSQPQINIDYKLYFFIVPVLQGGAHQPLGGCTKKNLG